MTTSPPVLATPKLPTARTVCLFAKTGFGKTSTCLCYADLWPRVIQLDTKARHTGQGEYPGLIASTPRELAKLLELHVPRPRFRIAYRGPVLTPADPAHPDGEQTSEPFFRALARIPNFLLVVEEAEAYMSPAYCPGGLFDMVRQGRTLGQGVIIMAHRPADVARKLTSVAEEIIAWPAQEPRDRDVLESRGFPTYLLDTLQRYQSIRMHAPEGEAARFYLCRCSSPHAGHCGEPLPRPPVKVPSHAES